MQHFLRAVWQAVEAYTERVDLRRERERDLEPHRRIALARQVQVEPLPRVPRAEAHKLGPERRAARPGRRTRAKRNGYHVTAR